MKHNFTQKELGMLSHGILSLIEIIDTGCEVDKKQKDHIKELQELNVKICNMMKAEDE